jgi:hypothetical protein
MAVLTNKRYLLAQELAVVASMGFMADKTILFHRGMLPQEGASLFCVAFVTKFIE